jgi:hypothetical protein
MQSLKRIALLFLIMTLALVSGAAFAQDSAQVRFVHAFTGAPNVDIDVNGETVAEDVAFGQASDFLEVDAGDIEIAVRATGESDALFEQTVTAGADPVTLVVSSAAGFTPYIDNVDPLSVGQARLTAIHAIEGGPVVDVILVDGRPVIAGLEYDVAYGTLDVPVFSYSLNVVPTGEGIASAIFEEPIVAPLATGTSYTAIVYGTADAPEVMLLAAPVLPNPGDGFLQVTHGVAGGPAVDVYANDNLIIPSLADGESTVLFPVPAGTYDVQVTEANTVNILVGGDVEVVEGGDSMATVTADGDDLNINVEIDDGAMMAEDTSDAEIVVEDSGDTSEEVVVAPTPEAVVEVVPTEAAVISSNFPTGRVLLDPGANLQLRQFPDVDSRSLGLVPSGAVVEILGREGAPVQIEGIFSQEIQDQIDNYVDPAEDLPTDEDLDPNNTWVQVSYTTPDAGEIEAWVLSQFLDINAPDGRPQRLANLPTIPSNDFGEAVNTEVTPPPPAEDIVTAQVFNLNPGVNLQIRRTANRDGESLGLVPNGTILEFIGYGIDPNELPEISTADTAEWMFIRYTPAEGGEVTGWVSTIYVQLYYRGERIDSEELDARNLLLFEDNTTRGELGTGAVAPPRPTVDPLRDQVVATVSIDSGANLQFRIRPDATSESLGLIPSDTQLIVSARTADSTWLLVEFEGQDGWVASNFVRLSFNGRAYDIEDLLIEDAG